MWNKAHAQQLFSVDQANHLRPVSKAAEEKLNRLAKKYISPVQSGVDVTSFMVAKALELKSLHNQNETITWERLWDFQMIGVEEFDLNNKSEVELRIAYEEFLALKKLVEIREIAAFQWEFNKLSHHLQKIWTDLLITLDGRDTAWKWGVIDRIHQRIDRKRFKNIAPWIPTAEERKMDYFERYLRMLWDVIVLWKQKNWKLKIKHTGNGRIITFDRSWYNYLYIGKVLWFCSDSQYEDYLSRVVDFEKSLDQTDFNLHKFYLSITKETQRQRLVDREWSFLKGHKVSKTDWVAHSKFDEFTPFKEKVFKKASSDTSPIWVVDSNDKHLGRLAILHTILYQYLDEYEWGIDLWEKLSVVNPSLVTFAHENNNIAKK